MFTKDWTRSSIVVVVSVALAACGRPTRGGAGARPAPSASPAPATSAATATPSASASVERPERGHSPFYGALAQLAKNPHAASATERDESFQGVAYTFYRYDPRPLAMPIDLLELHVRKSNPAAWFFVVRHVTDDPIAVDDFAPAGGTRSIGSDVPNGESVVDTIRKTALEYSVTKGPLSGCVLFVYGSGTIALKSHPEAYAR